MVPMKYEVLVQLAVIGILWVGLSFWKRKFPRFFPKKLYPVDLIIFYLIYCIHRLSMVILKTSLLPEISLFAALLGIGLTLFLAVTRGEIVYSLFWLQFWRIFGILVIISYLTLLLIFGLKFVS
jgi:hypothetical protein